ncbi:MAG: hypothetical protein KC457_36495, partial [Myxococcales bacterium]|nr:hypothetical protein [Myxococcales bacterium]
INRSRACRIMTIEDPVEYVHKGVLATLHSNEAVQAIDRIVDVFPSHAQPQVRSQLASSLVGVVSQRLLKRRDSGGRVAAFEVLVATAAIKNLVRENKMHQAASMMESGRREGNIPLDQSLQELLRRGLIDRQEAMRYMRDPLNAQTQQDPRTRGRSTTSTMATRGPTGGGGGGGGGWGR